MKERYETVLSLLKPHGPITGRAMFGGYGFYYDKVIFGILVRQTLYFRVGETNEKDCQLPLPKGRGLEGNQ
jgi:TfoX/Sxy family transcriptional regulator of competence genes